MIPLRVFFLFSLIGARVLLLSIDDVRKSSEIEKTENKKRKSSKELPFERCLAESNRSTRFCRPLPNRSVKTPNALLEMLYFSFAVAKVLLLFGSTKFLHNFFLVFFTFLVKRASSALIFLTFPRRIDCFPYRKGGIPKACHQYDSDDYILRDHPTAL